jgi:hypothetical protein
VTQTDRTAPSGLGGRSGGLVEPPSREAILRLRAWLAETAVGDAGTAVLKLRYLAARYGPPEIATLARPEQLARPPRRRQD